MRKNILAKNVSILLFIVVGLTLHAEDHANDPAVNIPPAVAKAIKLTAPVSRDTWAYTRTQTQDKETWVERFDPSQEPKWSILTVNGEKPSSEQINKRQSVFSERLSSDDQIGDNDFANLARSDSWEFSSSAAGISSYTFKPMADDAEDEKFMRYVEGTLHINDAQGHIEGFELKNIQAFKPVAVAKIKKFHMQLKLNEVAAGVHLPMKIETEVMGRAFFKKFEEKDLIEFSDFKRVN